MKVFYYLMTVASALSLVRGGFSYLDGLYSVGTLFFLMGTLQYFIAGIIERVLNDGVTTNA